MKLQSRVAAGPGVTQLSFECRCKAVGLDDIAPRVLRDGAKQLSPLITHIVNLSIESSTVPQDLKLAKVIPLFHQGQPPGSRKLQTGQFTEYCFKSS